MSAGTNGASTTTRRWDAWAINQSREHELSPPARHLLLICARYADNSGAFFASPKRLAADYGVTSRSAITDAFRELRGASLVTAAVREVYNGRTRWVRRFVVSGRPDTAPVREAGHDPVRPAGHDPVRPAGHRSSSSKFQVKKAPPTPQVAELLAHPGDRAMGEWISRHFPSDQRDLIEDAIIDLNDDYLPVTPQAVRSLLEVWRAQESIAS